MLQRNLLTKDDIMSYLSPKAVTSELAYQIKNLIVTVTNIQKLHRAIWKLQTILEMVWVILYSGASRMGVSCMTLSRKWKKWAKLWRMFIQLFIFEPINSTLINKNSKLTYINCGVTKTFVCILSHKLDRSSSAHCPDVWMSTNKKIPWKKTKTT